MEGILLFWSCGDRLIMRLRQQAVVIVLALCQLTFGPWAVCASDEIVRDPSAWDFAPLRYADVVVRGKVQSVELTEVLYSDLWSNPVSSNERAVLVEVALDVEEVLRGPAIEGHWSFIVWDDADAVRTFYADSDEVLICAYYHPRLDRYYQSSAYGRYSQRAGAWHSEMTPRGQRALRESEIRDVIEAASLRAVAASAELVIDAVIQSIEIKEIVGPDGAPAEFVQLVMRIERVRKGQYPTDTIVVSAITRGLYMPTWRAHVPRDYGVGQKWLCFLKKGEVGWYPFAGTNGFLRVETDHYLYDERVRYWQSQKDVELLIDKVVAEEVK